MARIEVVREMYTRMKIKRRIEVRRFFYNIGDKKHTKERENA